MSSESSTLLPEASLNLESNTGSNVDSNVESPYYEPDSGINWWIVVLIVVIILGIIGVILYFTVFRKKKCTSNADCNNQVCNINGECVDPDRKIETCYGENACKAPRICVNDVCECPSYESKAQDGKLVKKVGPNCEYNDELCNNQGIVGNDGKCVCNSYISPATGKSKQYIGKNCEMSDYDCKKDDIYGIKNANGTCDYCSPNGKKDEKSENCVCNHGFLMPYCRQKYTDANCNRGKVNDFDTTTNCLCEDGWDPATDCKECLPGRGPGNGDCSKQWKEIVMLTNDCRVNNNDQNCQEDSKLKVYVGNKNKDIQGHLKFKSECDTSFNGACKCLASHNTKLCTVLGWVSLDAKDETCNNNPRDGSSYSC